MRGAYIALLWFYPAKHRAVFAAEMLDTFERAASDWRARGVLAYWCFATWELTGLLHGLATEWIARRTGGEEYLRSCAQWEEECKQPKKAAELEKLVEKAIRNMEFAIAQHDFTRARFYSIAEQRMRKKLDQLR